MVIYIDMDDTLFDFRSAYNAALDACPDIQYPQSQYGFFTKLKLLPDANWAYEELKKEHRVYFLTAPSVMNPLCYTEKRISIEENFGIAACNALIFATDKSLLRGDILIDDRVDSNKQNEFQGELIQYGSENFPNWRAIVQYIQGLGKLDKFVADLKTPVPRPQSQTVWEARDWPMQTLFGEGFRTPVRKNQYPFNNGSTPD